MLSAAMLLPFASQAQNTLTVADGTTTNSYVPVYGFYVDDFVRCQTIYPASEILGAATNYYMTGGTITGLTYYLSSPAADSWGTASFVVNIKEVSATTLSAFVDMTDATTVYTGSLDATQSTMNITFTTPYTYQGGNLLIEIYNTLEGTYNSASFYGVSATSASWQGNNGTSVSAITGATRAFIPKTTFTFTGGTANTCPPVENLVATDITSTTATLSWSGNASGYTVYEYACVDSADYMYTDTFAVFNTLQPNTEYTFGVVADCGADGESVMRSVTFRTACSAIGTLPFTDGFENVPSGSYQMPFCWNRYASAHTSAATYPYSYSGNAHGGSRSLYFYGTTGSTYSDTMVAILPELDVAVYPMNANRVTFWAKMGAATNSKNVYVGTMTNPADLTSFALVDSTLVSGNTYTMYSVPLSNASAAAPYVALVVFKGTGTMYIDDVTLEEMPSCVEVTSLASSNIAANSATLTWEDNTNAAGTTYSIYDMETNTPVLVASNVTDTFYTLTGLTPNTSYTFGVQANCALGDATPMTTSFTTACATETMPWSENFDNWTSKSPCWSFLSGAFNGGAGTPSAYTSAWTLNTSYGTYITITGKALTMNIYSTNRYWAVTPNIDITSDDAMFTVDVAVAAWSDATPAYDANDTLAIAISTDGGSTFTALRVLDNTELNALTNTYTTITVPVTGYNNQTVRFAIFGGSSASGGDNRIAIDNVTVGETPNCMPVTGLTVSNITTDSATLTWAGDASSYTIYDLTDTSVVTTTTDTFYVFTNLDAMTQYSFGVVANCSGDQSVMMSVSFATACAAVTIPFTEDFEATSATLGCWSTEGAGNWTVGTGDYSATTGAFEGAANAKITHSSTGNVTKLISPVLDNVTDGIQLTYAHIQRAWSGDQDELRVYYRAGADSAWQQVAEYTTEISTWTVDNVLIPGEVYQVAFEMTDGYGYGVAIDSVVFNEPPSCMPVTDLTVDSVTATSVFLSWNGTANSYNIYNAMGSVVATGVTTTSYEVTGLTASTSYTFGVVADCGSSQSSAVIITAITDCLGGSCTITICAQDGYGDGWENSTLNITQNGAVVASYNMANQGLSNTTIYDTFQVSVCSGIPVSFSWTSGSIYDDEVGFSIVDGGGATVYTVSDASTLTSDAVFFTLNDACPSCVMPVVSLTDATMNSVTISWTGNAASYNVYNGTTFVANVTTNTYTFTGLTSSSTYTFGVEAVCSATDTSAMATITASTGCAVISTFPYTQDFAVMPACWNTIDADGDGYTWENLLGAMHSASYDNNVGVLYPDNWLITPQFQLATGTNYEVTWNANPQDISYPAEHYGIFVSTTSADTSAFTLIQDWTLTSAGHVPVIDLSSYAGQTIYLAFRHWNCSDMFRIAIDNFQLREAAGANQITVTLTQNNPMYGSVAGGGIYTIGDNVSVSATASTGYYFSKWVDTLGATVSTANPYTFVAATDVTLQAVFAAGSLSDRDSMQVTVAVNDATMGTTIPAPGVHYFYEGQEASVIAVPNTGYHLEGWTINVTHTAAGTLMDTTFNYAVEDVFDLFGGWEVEAGDGDYIWNVTANFALGNPPEQHDSLTFITAVNNANWGTVTPAPGTHYYVEGDNIYLNAVPNQGYYLAAIYEYVSIPGYGEFSDTITAADLEIVPGEAFVDTMYVDEDYIGMVMDLKFIFAPIDGETYTVTIAVNDPMMGTTTPAPGVYTYQAGETITVTADPYDGYKLEAWSTGETTNTITVTVTGDMTLMARFVPLDGIEDVDGLNVNVYSTENNIVVRGAEGYDVYVFDINGRMMAKTLKAGETESFRMPVTGVYIVKIGNVMTKRVVVIR